MSYTYYYDYDDDEGLAQLIFQLIEGHDVSEHVLRFYVLC